MSDILSKIKQIPFREDQYVKEETKKTQVVLHHTVSKSDAKAVASYWESTPDRVGVCIIVERDGTPYQIFSSKYWAGHLGLKKPLFDQFGLQPLPLDKTSIGIELCNWGGLKLKDGKYYNWYGNQVNTDVIKLDSPFRDYTYFERYTAEQIQTVKELLIYWNSIWNIPLDYNNDMWDLSKNALSGKPGIFSHISYRLDKSDLYPDNQMIDMLKNLK